MTFSMQKIGEEYKLQLCSAQIRSYSSVPILLLLSYSIIYLNLFFLFLIPESPPVYLHSVICSHGETWWHAGRHDAGEGAESPTC